MYLGEDQYGFRRGVGTRDAIAIMRAITERCIKHNQTVYVYFVDYEKAFNRIKWTMMEMMMKNLFMEDDGNSQKHWS